MNRYFIQTGNHCYYQVAKSIEAAVVAAFKRRAPMDPGVLTRARVAGGGPWLYVSSSAMLRKAGHKVRFL